MMKCIICYSRIDFTPHYLCKFSYTGFPWAIQVLCWCKWEQKLIFLFVYSQHTSRLFKVCSACICMCYSPFPQPALAGAIFSSGSSVSRIGHVLYFTPHETHIKGVQCSRIQMSGLPWVGRCVHTNACACSSLCREHWHSEESPCYASVVLQTLVCLQVSSRVWYLCVLLIWNYVSKV